MACPLLWGQSGEPIAFADLTVERYIAPMFPFKNPKRGGEANSEKQVRLELEDFKNRLTKKWILRPEAWEKDAELIHGATLTVIHNLVESAGLLFHFVSDSTGMHYLEFHMPRAPYLGQVEVFVGKGSAGTLDAWAPDPEASDWRRFPKPVQLEDGRKQIRIHQESDVDSPIFLRFFRLIPTEKGKSADTKE